MLGYPHPDHLLAQLTGPQLAEWKAYYSVEPWGDLRADFRAGQICATVANHAGKMRGEGAGLAHPGEFMPALNEGAHPRGKGPILLADPKAQSELLRKALFKKKEA